ncbi:preprotein translocase subunit SecF/SecD/SecF fusion protein [Alteribacillus persepolensis]|uniref:Protein-export membrane protein SecF n=1 Tax=Alteribacillus persepolensis TaxID=568899 RepID=A0A1G8DI41_9BACI|nr:protein translocase subunit SecF [Alteribacillus persepolensis]SDH57301.1 preprotein translocase subunit SecF/SecD/SecF fusion protein [Alteribacillus persepolensis]
MNFNTKNKYAFVKHRKKFFWFSLVFTLAGIILLSTAGLNLGIDFKSGSKVEVLADGTLTEDEVYNHFAQAGDGYEPDDVTLAGDNSEIAYASFIGTLSQDEIADIQTHFVDTYGNEPSVSTVSPQVGQELAKNALISVLIAAVGIIIYVSIRFQFLYGVASIVALLHDAFFIIVVFSIVQFEVNVPFIAAVLTIVGYSINDTIVTFDRIRENMRHTEDIKTFDELAAVVDLSLNQTLTRSINTVLTVVFAALCIFIFGGEAIRSFAFALVVGLVAGTYSSLFLAAQLWTVWKWKSIVREKNKPNKEEPEDLEPEV